MQTNVAIEAKLTILRAHIFAILDELHAAAEGGKATGDDVIELFGLGAATILADDDHIKTPRALRENAAAVGKLIEQRAKDLRLMSEGIGQTVLDILHSEVAFGVSEDPRAAARGNWLMSASDAELLAAYEATTGNPNDPRVEQLIHMIRFRGLHI